MAAEPPTQNPKSLPQEPALQEEILKIIRTHGNGDADRLVHELAPLLQRADIKARRLQRTRGSRFRRDPQAYLRSLEAQYAAAK